MAARIKRRYMRFWSICIALLPLIGCDNNYELETNSNVVLNKHDLEYLVKKRSRSDVIHLELGGDLREMDMNIILQLDNLESVFVYGAKNVDAFAAHVGKLRRLHSLTIQSSDLTEEGFQSLFSSASLRELRISENNIKMTREVVARMRANHKDSLRVLSVDVQFND